MAVGNRQTVYMYNEYVHVRVHTIHLYTVPVVVDGLYFIIIFEAIGAASSVLKLMFFYV